MQLCSGLHPASFPYWYFVSQAGEIKDKLVSWPIMILVSSVKRGKGTGTKREILLSASARALMWKPLWKFSWSYLDLLHFVIGFSIKKQTNKQKTNG